MKKLILALSFALTSAILFSACKKDNPAAPETPPIVGSWSETPASPNFQRTLFFSADGTFTMHLTYLGYVPGAETISGTYATSGEQLNLKVTKYVHTEPNKAPETLATNPQLYDQATYKINGNTLTFTYLSYPADAPVKTTATFLKN